MGLLQDPQRATHGGALGRHAALPRTGGQPFHPYPQGIEYWRVHKKGHPPAFDDKTGSMRRELFL